MTISASLVKELREKTNAGMMDCKKALEETGGNFEAAVEWLRKKGLASAAKKADRLAAEGLVYALLTEKGVTLLEMNSETDFVAKNELFQRLIKDLAQTLNTSDLVDDLTKAQDLKLPSGLTIAEAVKEGIAKIGENLVFRRFLNWRKTNPNQLLETYIHGDGKIGVVVELETNAPDKKEIKDLARDICLHIAAMNPIALNPNEVPAAVVEKEKEILRAKNLEQGKKPEMIDKIVEGQIRKFLSESCLLEQAFVKNPDLKVTEHIQSVAKQAGATVQLKRFKRFELGEGLEKKANNFAEEVAAQMKLHS